MPAVPRAHSRALRALVPRDAPLHLSLWFAEGVQRGRKASKLAEREVLALLHDFVSWCYANHWLPQADGAVQLAQIELLRRRGGHAPRTVEMPGPRQPGELTSEELAMLVADWEAYSYAGGLCARGDDDETETQLLCGALRLMAHLAAVDGVPVRLVRLDAVAFAMEVGCEHLDDMPPPPEGYATSVLRGAALLYDRAAERGFIPSATATNIAAQLRVLAVAHLAAADGGSAVASA